MNVLKLALFLCLFLSNFVASDEFSDVLPGLLEKSNSKKAKVIDQLAMIDDPRVLPTLAAMLESKLYTLKSDGTFVIVSDVEGGFSIADLNTGDELGVMGKKEVSKIRVNNKLRRLLRSNIAVLELSSNDKNVRLRSAKNLLKKPEESLRELLQERLTLEESNQVRFVIQQVIAILDLRTDDHDIRMSAVEILGDSVESEAVAALYKIVETIPVDENDEDGKVRYIETDLELVAFTEKKLKSVETKLNFFKFSENFIFGLSLGSILLLAAIGLAITFGVMGVINMAHGEMIMLGAYTTFAVQQLFPGLIDYSLLISIPAAFLVSGLVGIAIERFVIRHLYGRPLDTLLATFGISLILQQAVRTFRSNNVAVISPEWISGFWEINGAMSVTYNRIYILLFALIVLGLLALVLRKTMMGLQMRAVTQNRPMANSMGIKSSWVDALTFGLGSGIAGIAGVALSQITNIGPNMGQAYIIDSFMVVVFGGVGNLLGTFFGAMSLGVANKFLEPYTGAVVGKIIVLVFIILFIQWRPRGMFALKGRFVDD